MFARKKVGPRPLPLRDLDAPRALSPVAAAHIAGPAALVLAAASLLACATSQQPGPGVVEVVGTTAPTECPRLGGAPPVPQQQITTPPATSASATPSATAAGHIQPIVDPPPLGGEPPAIR